jgi:hypothetical protein
VLENASGSPLGYHYVEKLSPFLPLNGGACRRGGVAAELIGVEGAWLRRGDGGCSGGRCVAFGPDLRLDGPERAVALGRDGIMGDDVFGVAAMVVIQASTGGPLHPSPCWLVVMPVVVNGPLLRRCSSLTVVVAQAGGFILAPIRLNLCY